MAVLVAKPRLANLPIVAKPNVDCNAQTSAKIELSGKNSSRLYCTLHMNGSSTVFGSLFFVHAQVICSSFNVNSVKGLLILKHNQQCHCLFKVDNW